MERIEVISHAAAALWARCELASARPHGIERIETLCNALDLGLEAKAADDVMLGGAFSRLQLWAWDQPELGGIIWLRADLEAEIRLFAIAHELGHYMLHRGEGISLHPACDQHQVDQRVDPGDLRTEDHRVEEYTPRARRELEANAFAAELLAPRDVVRRLFVASPGVDLAQLAARFGISRMLAHRRLIDAVLTPTRHKVNSDLPAKSGSAAAPATSSALIAQLDEWQRQAARTAGPALVVAGPGTGKTATLVGRVAHLVGERGVPAERVLALTFSNRAAGEMRERLARSGLPGERLPIMTIHAFATSLLREYASHVPQAPGEASLTPDFRILDQADAFLLMEESLNALPLRYYRSLGNPTAHLHTLLADFSQARDSLLTPADYLALVDAMPLAPAPDADSGSDATTRRAKNRKSQPPAGTYTAEQIAKARERAQCYAVWDHELRRRGLVDFGGLIQRAVELLRADPAVLAHVRDRYPELLVDEFQDTNHAAAELLLLVAGASGAGLWVVGDRNQSIYRFRGASPRNLPRLVEQYPELRVLMLRRCYRSVPDIVRLGSAMAARMAELSPGADTGSAMTYTETSSETTTEGGMSALSKALRPLDLKAVRDHGAHPALLRGEAFVSAAHERIGLAAAIQRHHALGFAYGEQAALCRTHKQARQIASVLASQGVPVSQLGDFFDRAEVKDALMLVTLAAGPDARGVLRAAPLLVGLGYSAPAAGELATAARALAAGHRTLPSALRGGAALDGVSGLSATTRASLAALGEVAMQLRGSPTVGAGLADYLLRPRGYAWRLARLADEIGARAEAQTGLEPGAESPARARQALTALGELVRLAWRFDIRWAREPEFRARLSQAVTHRRAAQPATPDTLESTPAADVTSERPPTAPEPPAGAPAARCFLHYLAALRGADAAIPLPTGEEDAVHVLTLHQSKGLEFPVVYLPGLAYGQFPATVTGREEVCPPGFRERDMPGEREAEERCLFYVGVTRARDVVVFTRAASYSATAGAQKMAAQPSMLLSLVEDAPSGPSAAPLLSEEELDRLATLADALDLADAADDEEDRDEEAEVAVTPAPTQALGDMPAKKPVFHLRELEQYITCPRQYKYARGYGLLDPAEDVAHRFHRYIRRGAQTLRDLRAAAPQADWQAAEKRLRTLWETDGAAGHAYDAFYWRAAEKILREEWRALTAPEAATAPGVLLAQPLQAELRRCHVEVTADRVIDGILPEDDAAVPLTALVRLHTGRPRAGDKDDLALPLYYLARQQSHPSAPVRITLAYVGSALADEAAEASPETSAATLGPGPGDLVDVTESARQAAETYLKPDRKRRSKLDKLDDAASGILAGRFAPKPEEHRCAACAYCYVCPADPESAEAPLPAQAAGVPTVGARRAVVSRQA